MAERVICRVCSEPWDGSMEDGYELDGYELNHRELEALRAGRGCPACHGYPFCRCGHDRLKHRTHRGTDGACSGIVGDPCSCSGYAPERLVANLGGPWEIGAWLEEAG
ncbi:MAG TPA: hypothetical protein VFD01_06155 [Candidatus Dormibacteraeota bacterium]|jgi:hypothetical protein|nr:hypothetical protein [Candidatus Dormibacteraeota bacterium]